MSCIVSRISFTDIPWETIVNFIAPHLTMKEYGSLSIQKKYLRDLFTSNDVWKGIYIKFNPVPKRTLFSDIYEEMIANPYLLPCQREKLKKMYARRVKKESKRDEKKESKRDDKIQYRRETLSIFLNKKELNYRKLEDKNEFYKKQIRKSEEKIHILQAEFEYILENIEERTLEHVIHHIKENRKLLEYIKENSKLLEENERKILDSSVHMHNLYNALKTK